MQPVRLMVAMLALAVCSRRPWVSIMPHEYGDGIQKETSSKTHQAAKPTSSKIHQQQNSPAAEPTRQQNPQAAKPSRQQNPQQQNPPAAKPASSKTHQQQNPPAANPPAAKPISNKARQQQNPSTAIKCLDGSTNIIAWTAKVQVGRSRANTMQRNLAGCFPTSCGTFCGGRVGGELSNQSCLLCNLRRQPQESERLGLIMLAYVYM